MELSVIIPSYNSQDHLPSTLKALTEQENCPDLEVFVVDCSEGDAVASLSASFQKVKLLRETTRFNPGIGRNIGAQQASGAALLFVDSDVVLEPQALRNAWTYYKQGHLIFGGALELNESKGKSPASFLEHFFFNHESQKGRPSCPRINLSSALMVVDRAVFASQGGFKDIPRMQDTEMTERLIKAGHKLSFTPDVVGLQTQDAPLAQVLRKVYINGKNLFFIRYASWPSSKRILLGGLLPLLTTFKVMRIVARHLRYQGTRNRVVTVLLIPHLSVAGLYWMLGLYRSLLFGGEIDKKRH